MKAHRQPTPDEQHATREALKCPRCGSRDVEIETTMLGGVTRYECGSPICRWTETMDPRLRRQA